MIFRSIAYRLGGLTACLVAVTPPSIQAEFDLPDGFLIEQVAGPPEIQFPMFACFDDRGRLYVAESSGLDLYAELQKLTRKCRISVLEDRDGDGRYERAHVYADKLVFPMGLAWKDGRLYLPDGPELIALEDRDGDDVAETRTVLIDGFGHTDNGALHGQIIGPDGLLYGTMGSPDGYKITTADGTTIRGHTGILLRSRTDGSRPEVLARGFSNLVEVDFLPTGEIVGSNNWIQEPAGGLRDSLVHLVEGGLYGYWEDLEGDTPPLVTGPKLPALTIMPATACSGLTRYRGSQFPRQMRGNLFVAQFNTRGITRHVLKRNGSTFRSRDLDFLTTDAPDFHPADVIEDADGSLLVLDTGAWYVQHCPTGSIRLSPAKGAVYRIRYTRCKPVADPRGLKIDWLSASTPQLVRLLGDPRFVVRRRATFALAQRNAKTVNALSAAAGSHASPQTKQHVIWALAAIDNPSATVGLSEILTGKDADTVALAARAISRRGDRSAASQLHRLLEHDAAGVRMAAAEALVHCGGSESVPLLVQSLARDPDRFLQHVLTVGLSRLADRQALQEGLDHPNPRVQQAAMLLLDQPPHSCLAPAAVVARASAADGDLRRTARTILQKHPRWASHAVDLVRNWIHKQELTQDEAASLRDFILAFQADPAVQETVAGAMRLANDRFEQRHILLLQTMAQCTLAELPDAWKTAVTRAAVSPNGEIRQQAIRTLATLQITSMDETLAKVADDPRQPATLRVEALRAIVRRRPDLSDKAFRLLLSRLSEDCGPLDRLAAGEVVAQARLDAAGLQRLIDSVQDDPVIAPTVVLAVFERSHAAGAAPKVVDYLAERMKTGRVISQRQRQLVLAALPPQQRIKARETLKEAQQSTDVVDQAARLAEYEPLLKDGNASHGRTLFFGKAACSTCHTVGQQGGTIGPDLTTIGKIRSGRDLIESLVLPGATIAQNYETYVVITGEGKTFQGILARRSAQTVVLYDVSGAELRLRTDEIDEMAISNGSLMPNGLLGVLTREDVRDLLAYLQGLK